MRNLLACLGDNLLFPSFLNLIQTVVAGGEKTVHADVFNSRHRNNLQVDRQQLQRQVDAISNQLEETKRRIWDLECAAQASVSSNSGWNRNTHDLFVKNLSTNTTHQS